MSEESRSFHFAALEADVPAGGVLGVDVAGRPVALFKLDGVIYALEDLCTHAGAKLSEGPVEDGKVTCPWHDAVFDIATGSPCGGPAFSPAEPFRTRVEDGRVLVEVPD